MAPRVNGARVAARGAATSWDWWLAGGTVTLAQIAEYVENPTTRQLYAGATLSNAWTVSFRTNLTSVPAVNALAFDAQFGRFIIGRSVDAGVNGFYDGTAWRDVTLFSTGDHTYIIVSDAANIQCYRDGSAVGGAYASTINIGGAVRWLSRYADSSGWQDWPVAIRCGHVANVALDATQRAALHTAMIALP